MESNLEVTIPLLLLLFLTALEGIKVRDEVASAIYHLVITLLVLASIYFCK